MKIFTFSLFVSLCFVMLFAVKPAAPMDLNLPYQAGFPVEDMNSTVDFASPTVANIDQSDDLEIIVADGNGCLYGWDKEGHLLPGFPWQTGANCTQSPRINGPLAVGDVNGDGEIEIVAGTRGEGESPGQLGKVFVWDKQGNVLPGWPQEMLWNGTYSTGMPEVYSVVLANILGNSALEIIAGTSNNASSGGDPDEETPNLHIWSGNSSPLPGYPVWYRTAGIYGFVGAADMTGDNFAEIITARDHSHFHIYRSNGQQLPSFPFRVFLDEAEDTWNEDKYLEFTRSAPVIGDLTGDGMLETAVIGKVRDPQQGRAVIGSALIVLQADGHRPTGWSIGKEGGLPLTDSYLPSEAPALADLTGDGRLEIIAPYADGKLRTFTADGSLLWEYDFAQGHTLFSSEPVIGDISGDGLVDVLIGTYSPDGSADALAGLIGLTNSGQLLAGFPLPLTHEGDSTKKGLRAAPTLADIDQDCDVEIIVASRAAVLYVWDLPAVYDQTHMPWPTSRHDQQRTGSVASIWQPPANRSQSPSTIYFPLIQHNTSCSP